MIRNQVDSSMKSVKHDKQGNHVMSGTGGPGGGGVGAGAAP